MKAKTSRWMFFVLFFLLATHCSNSSEPQTKIEFAAEPFSLHQVRLLDGPFHDAMLRTQKYLLQLDSDRLLHNFRINAGIPSSAKPLGGWEAPDVELRGHSLGHFLSACALMYASTGDERFKLKAERMVEELAKIDPNTVAFLYGPIVLAGDLGQVDEKRSFKATNFSYCWNRKAE